MIAVFIPGLILEIVTSYSFIKVVTKNIPVVPWDVFDFVLWNAYTVAPTFLAAFISSVATTEAGEIGKILEKHSNSCHDSIVQNVRLQRISESFHSFLCKFLD